MPLSYYRLMKCASRVMRTRYREMENRSPTPIVGSHNGRSGLCSLCCLVVVLELLFCGRSRVGK